MKYLLIICCATEEEIYSYIYSINVQLKGTQRYLARGRTSYPIFLFYYLFIIFLFFDVTPNDTRPSATITNRQLWNSSLEESASCARARPRKMYRRSRKRSGEKITNASRYHLPGVNSFFSFSSILARRFPPGALAEVQRTTSDRARGLADRSLIERNEEAEVGR